MKNDTAVAGPKFTVEFQHEPSGESFTLEVMLEGNHEDETFCGWLRCAEVGQEYRVGGGASPLCITRRVS